MADCHAKTTCSLDHSYYRRYETTVKIIIQVPLYTSHMIWDGIKLTYWQQPLGNIWPTDLDKKKYSAFEYYSEHKSEYLGFIFATAATNNDQITNQSGPRFSLKKGAVVYTDNWPFYSHNRIPLFTVIIESPLLCNILNIIHGYSQTTM